MAQIAESFDCERANEIFRATNNIKNVETKTNHKKKFKTYVKRFKIDIHMQQKISK